MKIAEVQLNPWETPVQCLLGELELKTGDYVVLETEANIEIGKIIGLLDLENKAVEQLTKEGKIKTIIRKAALNDLELLEGFEKKKEEALVICKKLISKHQLPMKLVDVSFSFDDKKVTFAFIA